MLAPLAQRRFGLTIGPSFAVTTISMTLSKMSTAGPKYWVSCWNAVRAIKPAMSAYNIGLNSNRLAAGLRYVAKIDRHLEQLKTPAL